MNVPMKITERDRIEWWSLRSGVPDLTNQRRWKQKWCAGRHKNEWLCTRRVGHTGRHAAGDGNVIVAVWSDHNTD